MKIRERKVTRTITILSVNAKIYDEEHDEIKMEYAEIIGDYDEKEIKAILTERGYTILKLTNIDKSELKYEMSEEDFVKNAKRTNNYE